MTSTPSDSAAPKQRQRTIYLLAMVGTAALAGFLFGFAGSLIGVTILFLRDQFHLSDAATGFTVASGAIGCIIGPFLGSWLCDKIGREKTLLGCVALLGLADLMTFLAGSLAFFICFRIVGGLGIGLGSIASPMYIAEITPPAIRGKCGISYSLAVVIGSTAAPLAAYPLAQYLPDTLAWRWMYAVEVMIAVLLLALLYFLPPSPRWLVEKGRFDEAFAILRKIHGSDLALSELAEIKASINQETGSWSELWQPGIRYALLIGLLLAFFNNWTGWSAMSSYITTLVDDSGASGHGAGIMGFAYTYLIMGVATVISMVLVDRIGRRSLWMTASLMMASTTFIAGLVFHFHVHGILVLVALMLCAVPHGIALGGLPWLMMSELFPNRIRARAVAVTTTFLWLVIFSCAQLFPIFASASTKAIGSVAGVFWLFTFVCVLSALFGWKMLPETKGRTLENIADSWKK
jgi:SP family arabinose:H+ symporter-like MFS transporter